MKHCSNVSLWSFQQARTSDSQIREWECVHRAKPKSSVSGDKSLHKLENSYVHEESQHSSLAHFICFTRCPWLYHPRILISSPQSLSDLPFPLKIFHVFLSGLEELATRCFMAMSQTAFSCCSRGASCGKKGYLQSYTKPKSFNYLVRECNILFNIREQMDSAKSL